MRSALQSLSFQVVLYMGMNPKIFIGSPSPTAKPARASVSNQFLVKVKVKFSYFFF